MSDFVDTLPATGSDIAGRGGFVAFVIAAAMVATCIGNPTAVFASETLESIKGGLFHRKGWVSPAIYRKVVPIKPQQAVQRKQARGKSAKRPRQRTSKLRHLARSTVPRVRKNRKVRSKRSIPVRIIRRRERKLSRASRGKRTRVRVASLGRSYRLPALPTKRFSIGRSPAPYSWFSVDAPPSAHVQGIQWLASSKCIPDRLRAAINHVALNFGRVRVNSTCRSKRHNRRVGGARRSWHLKSRAADIRVFGNIRKAARYLRRVVGGYKHYGGGLFHIDTGPRRTW